MDARTVADRLIAAEREHRTVDPFTDTFPFLRDEQAYAAQWLVVQAVSYTHLTLPTKA